MGRLERAHLDMIAWVGYRGTRDQHGVLEEVVARHLPHVWKFSTFYRKNPAFRPFEWSVVWPRMIYSCEAGLWLRDQYGTALLHYDSIAGNLWNPDGVWAMLDTEVFFKHPEDCFACQLRFR